MNSTLNQGILQIKLEAKRPCARDNDELLERIGKAMWRGKLFLCDDDTSIDTAGMLRFDNSSFGQTVNQITLAGGCTFIRTGKRGICNSVM